ncbi:hypothetical protein CC2G_007074 [Coprinopsis cinerea AmutBmut pab1-1]|nr:hypothetical protein CC2G_007074 [Coprinopsis cinerea AmutBmut pab1-1]
MSRLLTTLVSSIRSGDLDFLHSLLFSPAVPASSPASLYPMSVPILVNFPDSKGWSLIHHAVSLPRPSIDVIDSLYCAGADTALFTAHEQWTPLHILARSATVTPGQHDDAASLYQLVVHLIRDLRAPLSARDKDDETCIHIAAEHGQSLELLTYLLECDKSGTVRQLKNSRGLTPLQVAKPEFLAAFGPDIGILQLITPSLAGMSVTSNDSLATLSDSIDPDSVQDATSSTSSVCSPSQIDATLTSQLLITNLRLSSPDGHHVNEPGHLRKLESILADSRQNQQRLVQYFRDRIKEAETELQELKKNAQRVDFLRETVATAASEKLSSKGIQPLPPKVYHRDSEDSQSTAVSQGSSRDFLLLPSPVSHQAPPRLRINTKTLNGRPSVPTFSSLFQQSESPSPFISPYSSKDNSPLDEDHKVYRDSRLAMFGRRSTPDLRQSKSDSPKKKKKELEQAKGEKGLSGTMRFKAWLKKMVHHEDLTRSQLAADTQKPDPAPLPTIQVSIAEDIDRWDPAIDTALRTSMVVLEAAERDLCNIHLCLNSAEQFIGLANHSVNKVERAMKRAFKLRQQMITKLRSSKPGSRWYNGDIIGPNHSPSSSLFPPPSPIHLRPSIASISSISTQSSVASAAATITEHDDEDTRVIRRLLLRKIEAQSSGAWEELEKALSWLRIVKEVVRGVKRRAYL